MKRTAKTVLADIKKHPERHRHDFDDLIGCCMIDGALDCGVMEAIRPSAPGQMEECAATLRKAPAPAERGTNMRHELPYEIRTPDDWWQAVEEQWAFLTVILGTWLDFKSPAYDVPGNPTSQMTGRNIVEELEYLKRTKDNRRLARYFFAAWDLASESYARSRPPAWSTLCDLLSEEWVFNEEE